MKKLLSLLIIFSLAFTAANAQSYNAKIKGLDTLTNAVSDTANLTVIGSKTNIGFQYNVTKISGTVAGTIKTYGTKDGGVHYQLLQTDNLTDASGVFGYTASYNGYGKYRIIIATTGTQSSSHSVWALYRP